MKKVHVLASVLSTVAIAGGVVFSNSAEACPFSGKYKSSQSGNSLISLNSWLSKTFPGKSNLTIAGIAAGSIGLMGLGAFYANRSLTRRSQTTFDAVNESMETPVEETLVQQHPEAPGGEFDLVEDNVNQTASEILADTKEKETVLVK
ncbi:MAG: hypothetical protein QNJ68_16175 [Microcoleaceae cyanobacterium MO_207.B10]|nr:hypothetical protein [Microcoleaceae cyanobacterium MO_207.B10]